jgi:3-dehydroquinate synthase
MRILQELDAMAVIPVELAGAPTRCASAAGCWPTCRAVRRAAAQAACRSSPTQRRAALAGHGRSSRSTGPGFEPRWLVLEPGEGAKSWAVLERTVDWLLAEEVERGDHVLALGGGVIGDLTGFACAILKRGCGFVQIAHHPAGAGRQQRRRQDRDQRRRRQEPGRRLPPAGGWC